MVLQAVVTDNLSIVDIVAFSDYVGTTEIPDVLVCVMQIAADFTRKPMHQQISEATMPRRIGNLAEMTRIRSKVGLRSGPPDKKSGGAVPYSACQERRPL